MKIVQSLLTLLAAVLILSGCSSTTVNRSWKDPQANLQIKKPYLVAIFKDELQRRSMEDRLKEDLTPYGVNGVSSYRDLPASRDTDKREIASKVKSNGADSILMVRKLSQRTEQVVEPGQVTGYTTDTRYPDYRRPDRYRNHLPRDHYYDYGRYYTKSYEVVYTPPQVTDFVIDTLEVNLYDASNDQMVWSAQFDVVDDATPQALLDDFLKKLVEELRGDGLL